MFSSSATQRTAIPSKPKTSKENVGTVSGLKKSVLSKAVCKLSNQNPKVNLTRPTAPLASLSFAQRKALAENSDASTATTGAQTAKPRKQTTPTTTAAKLNTRPSLAAKPRIVQKIQPPAQPKPNAHTARLAAPKSVVSHTTKKPAATISKPSRKDDGFGSSNIDEILKADSAVDLDLREYKLSKSNAAGIRPGMLRRNTTFAGSQSRIDSSDSDKKRASIYAGPVRVVKKNPNATVPVILDEPSNTFQEFQSSIARESAISRPPQRIVGETMAFQSTTLATMTERGGDEINPFYFSELPKSASAFRGNSYFAAASSGLVPLPQTPLKPPQRVPVGPNAVQNDMQQHHQESQSVVQSTAESASTTGTNFLAEAVASTRLYRAASTTAPSLPQILHTPRRVQEQAQARSIGMAVLDMLGTPGTRVGASNDLRAAAVGSLLAKLKAESVDDNDDATLRSGHGGGDGRLELLQRPVHEVEGRVSMEGENPVSNQQGNVSHHQQPLPRMMLPDPLAVLAAMDGLSVSEKMEPKGEDAVRTSVPEVMQALASCNDNSHDSNSQMETKIQSSVDVAQLPVNEPTGAVSLAISDYSVAWKEVSPRRESESGEFRTGIRGAPVLTPPIKKAKEVENLAAAVPLTSLEQRFREISSQLLGGQHLTVAPPTAAKAAEPESVNITSSASATANPYKLSIPTFESLEDLGISITELDEQERLLQQEIDQLSGKI